METAGGGVGDKEFDLIGSWDIELSEASRWDIELSEASPAGTC